MLELHTARSHLDTARHHLGRPDFEKAIVFLELARTECLQVKEMLGSNATEQRAVYKIIVRLTKLIASTATDDENEEGPQTKMHRVQESREICDAMDQVLVRLRYRLENKGKQT